MAVAAARSSGLVLTQSKPLRLLSLFLLYFTQGVPVGVFSVAIPAWMAANGMSAGQVAGVVGISLLPWSLKLVNGFILDRYTYLPMGRRRAWIVGAQLMIVISLLVGAVISPPAQDVFLLSAIGFASNTAVTFQDVGIDSLAVDIMPEDERAKASGVMFGSQMLGISATSAVTGWLLESAGFASALIVASLAPLAVALFLMTVREREGEKLLPWTSGEAHPRNKAIQVEAWVPLLRETFKALIVPVTLILLVVNVFSMVPYGGYESFHPVLSTQFAGWDISDYTSTMGTATLAAGLIGLIIGGWMVDFVGAQRSALGICALTVAALITMALLRESWSEGWPLAPFFISGEVLGTMLTIAVVPICMRACTPSVAATQFTIFMAAGNFGRPLGASITAALDMEGSPTSLYWALAALVGVAAILLYLVRFPADDRAFEEAAEGLPQGEGIPAAQD